MTESQLCTQLFPPVAAAPPSERPLPDCVYLHDELKRKGVTLMLLWEEYQAEHPEGYRYSHFCELYRRWARTLRVSMRQVHKACAAFRPALRAFRRRILRLGVQTTEKRGVTDFSKRE